MSTAVNARFAKLDQVRAVIHGARDEVVVVLPRSTASLHERIEVAAARDVADRGVNVRMFLSRSGDPTGPGRPSSAYPWPRVEVVQTEAMLPHLTVVDQRIIILPESGDEYRDGALVAAGLSFIPLLLWAVKAAGAGTQHPEERTYLDHLDIASADVLRQMSQGFKDETAARNVGVSLRTYRRTVAQLMDRLNAQSRFQAGYQAAQLGLF